MKLRERKFYSYVFDLPGHFNTPHSGENCLGKPEVRHEIDSVLLEYRTYLKNEIQHFRTTIDGKSRYMLSASGLLDFDGLKNC